MRIVDVTLPVTGGLEPTTLRLDPHVAIVDTDRITAEQFRASLDRLLRGHLDARWTVSVDGAERPVTRAMAERIGQLLADRPGIQRLDSRPSGVDRLELLAVRTGLELQGRLGPRCTPELVASGLEETERREERHRAELDRRLTEAEYRRNQRAAQLEEGRGLPAEERADRAAALEDAERQLRSLREQTDRPEPRNLCAAYVFSLHQRRGGRAGLLVGDLDRLNRSVAVLADGRDPFDVLTDAGFGAIGDRLIDLVDAQPADPDLGRLPLVLEPLLRGTDPDLAAHALRKAATVTERGQVIVLGPSPAAEALRVPSII